jgi:hypothetical protein
MRNVWSFWMFACSLGLSCVECSSYGQSKPPESNRPIETTVCQLVANCKRFDGSSVQFRASVSSDWFEHTALVDPECKRGIVPRTSEEADKRPDVAASIRLWLKESRGPQIYRLQQRSPVDLCVTQPPSPPRIGVS